MKKFFVSKSDNNRVHFIKDSIKSIKPDNVYIICENERKQVYKDIDAVVLPLKDLNKCENWILFKESFTGNSLLVVDNILKFVFFGDGKKKYLKDYSQSINNIIVTDVVPFYTEPSEIFYPFYFLGKGILGYNNYSAFASNNLEETKDGEILDAHSFDILKEKIKDYYIQDYECFFSERLVYDFELSEFEIERYNDRKEKESDNYSNPIKLFNACSEEINLTESRFEAVNKLTIDRVNKKGCIVINCGGIFPKMYLKRMQNKNIDFKTIHSDISEFKGYDYVILAEMPIVKSYNWIYIESVLDCEIIQLNLTNNNLEKHFNKKIFNNELRKQFDTAFYNANM